MKLNVLLVDDNRAVRKMIAAQLQDWGYRVWEASSGFEVLEDLNRLAISENRPNILLVDWHMPELDGITLCERIKSLPEYKTGVHLYVLFLTVSEGTECETQAFQAGADGYIVKGSWEELQAKLNSVKARIVEELELRNTIAALQEDPSGVLVKREIMNRLERRTADLAQAPMGIILLDIDDFKKVNDVHGHLVGDQILKAVGWRLQDAVRNGNVGRFGGDEFLIGLPGCDRETTETRAQEIVSRLCDDPIATTDGEIKISVTYGIAVNSDPVSLDQLLGIADQVLYRQKHKKKQRR
jgi:two-component system cell cycle response regulator